MRTSTFATHRDALTFVAALIGWAVFLEPLRTSVVAIGHVPITSVSNQPSTAIAAPSNRPSDFGRRGSDVVFEDYPLGDVELALLQPGDQVEWPHPDGGIIELRVERAESANGRRHLVLVHDRLVSTFTEAHGAFLGTLATPRGVFALEGDAQSSRLTRHALLDLRMNAHALDYRQSPAS